jgi:hydrogenase nickel incorporation protein HypA/HybF
MHEMSIAESVLGIVAETARAARLGRVSAVRLEIGALAAVEAGALRFCFDAVTRGSLAEGAALEIDEVPGAAWCFGCSEAVVIAHRAEPCPRCGGARLQVTGGTEMRVKDIRGNQE